MAAVIEYLVPEAEYQGSATGWDEAKHGRLRWHDVRDKPTWAQMQAARSEVPAPEVIPTAEELIAAIKSLADEGDEHAVERRISDRAAQIAQQRAST